MVPPKHGVTSRSDISSWLRRGRKTLEQSGIPVFECVQEQGDVLYIPEFWSRGNMFLAESVGIEGEFNVIEPDDLDVPTSKPKVDILRPHMEHDVTRPAPKPGEYETNKYKCPMDLCTFGAGECVNDASFCVKFANGEVGVCPFGFQQCAGRV